MNIFTYIIMLMMEYSYLTWLLAEKFRETAFVLSAAIAAASAVGVWIYSRVRKVADTKAVMRTGTVLVYGTALGVGMICLIVQNWRWLI